MNSESENKTEEQTPLGTHLAVGDTVDVFLEGGSGLSDVSFLGLDNDRLYTFYDPSDKTVSYVANPLEIRKKIG